MRITFKMEGGFVHLPNLQQPFQVDTAELESAEASQLEALVHQAQFFDQPSGMDSTLPAGADRRFYQIRVEDGPRIKELQLRDPVDQPGLRMLIERLQALLRSHLAKKSP